MRRYKCCALLQTTTLQDGKWIWMEDFEETKEDYAACESLNLFNF